MKLYNSIGPNPKVVRMFAAERGIDLELHEVDLMTGENRQEDFLRLNPAGQLPALETENGDILSEITAICEYLEEREGASSLIGTTPAERAETRMWVRRIDLGILENLANGFRFAEGKELFDGRMTLVPHAADDLKAIAQEKLTWLDGQMAGKQYICGDRFTLADIMLFAFLEFGEQVGQPLNTNNGNIMAWWERIKSRPSATA
jgi:glutathione S-transferase